jgi:hypothetical protein
MFPCLRQQHHKVCPYWSYSDLKSKQDTMFFLGVFGGEAAKNTKKEIVQLLSEKSISVIGSFCNWGKNGQEMHFRHWGN